MQSDTINKKITQREIAEKLGISQGIVSVVLRGAPASGKISDQTKRRVFQLARQCEYPVVSGGFRPGKNRNVIGIIVKKEVLQFFQDLTTLLNDELERRNYRCIVSRIDLEQPDHDPAAFLEQLVAYNYAGLICLGHFSPKLPDLVPKSLEHYPNIVFLNTPRGISQAPCVRIDFGNGVTEAVRMLHETGRRRIALCLNDMISDSTKGRFAGYCAGLQAMGVSMQPELCWVAEDYGLRAWEGESVAPVVERIMDTLIADYRPDAVIAPNDQWATGLIRALKRRGFTVPSDVAVVGYGNYPAYCETCEPELASISHGNEAIAERLAHTIDGLITGTIDRADPEAAISEVKSCFIPRESCRGK